ncbi:hypothetical protein WMW72_33710 [Paenibacillus filicis]|uniref:Uncharacterized protein n=1 Tax=Paenibacillus filicis TaxID=669464 RepID=A0ABU9DVE9_9BACL
MMIEAQEQSSIISDLQKHEIPIHVMEHVQAILHSSVDARFFLHMEKNTPVCSMFLVEDNPKEAYSVGHLFSCDPIGDDYLYQYLSVEQLRVFGRFLSCLPIH